MGRRDTSQSNLSRFAVVMALSALAGCRAGSDDGPPLASVASAVTEARRVTFTLPAGIDFSTVAVGANGILRVDDRAQILTTTTGGFAPSTNAGTGPTALNDYGIDARVGTITSN